MILRIVAYIILLIASFVFSSYYGGYVPELMRYTLMMLPFMFISYICLVYISFKPRQKIASTSLVKGQETEYVFQLRNSWIFPFINIKLSFHDRVADITMSEGIDVVSLYPMESLSRKGKILCRYAGTYNVGVDMVTIPDFAGIFRIKFRFRRGIRVHVKPQEQLITNIKGCISGGQIHNAYGKYYIGREITGYTVRDYIPGDSPRKIHWKNSARLNKLVTRQSEDILEKNTEIIIDTCMAGQGVYSRIVVVDKILHIVAAIANTLAKSAFNYTLSYSQNKKVQRIDVTSEEDYKRFYEECSAISFLEPAGIAKTLTTICSLNRNCTKNLVIITSGAGKNSGLITSVNESIMLGNTVTVINVTSNMHDELSGDGTYEVINIDLNEDICEVLSE